jgi:poly-gamma-glutamate synthesis protein (capsule biosynthesis protein)
MQDYLQSSDLTFGNLETPITEGRLISDYEMIFRSNPGTEQALKRAGFSILSMANNHTPNFGDKGLKDTFSYLEDAGIKYIGAGKDATEAKKGLEMERLGVFKRMAERERKFFQP